MKSFLVLIAVSLYLFCNVALTKQYEQQKMCVPALKFQPGLIYKFQYNAQISSGLIAQDEQSQADAQAITRIQAHVNFTFDSPRRGMLCLRKIRFGQLSEPVQNVEEILPLKYFEPKIIPSDKKRLLERCCQFDYADGVIERVQFDQEDEAWSKNMKKGILQMIQLNLKGNNAQGLRNEMNDQCGQKNQQEKNILAMNFTISDAGITCGLCRRTCVGDDFPTKFCDGLCSYICKCAEGAECCVKEPERMCPVESACRDRCQPKCQDSYDADSCKWECQRICYADQVLPKNMTGST